jgi:hypothetical protein
MAEGLLRYDYKDVQPVPSGFAHAVPGGQAGWSGALNAPGAIMAVLGICEFPTEVLQRHERRERKLVKTRPFEYKDAFGNDDCRKCWIRSFVAGLRLKSKASPVYGKERE